MEGIMMRGPKRTAMAVRNTKGEIVIEEFENKMAKRPKFCRWPVIRGLFGYIDSMTLGYKCLMRSAELSGLEDLVEESPRKKKKRLEREAKLAAERGENASAEEPIAQAEMATEEKTEEDKKKDDEKVPAWVVTLMMVFSFVLAFGLAIGLFMFLPTFLYQWLAEALPFLKTDNLALNSLIKSVFEGVLKIFLLVGYMAAITLMKDIRRTFMYHGAEHKTIFCYEAGLELTVENVKKQRRFHPRCGTSFLILMLLVSIFISFFIDPISIAISGDVLPTVWRVLVKLLLIPVIVGLGYELIKFAGRHDNALTRIISAPGVWLQHITVFEPTDDMIECAIDAISRVIPNDESDNW
ncbi:MAG: DUF1385 domain-containing protein [Clostridia bacterium]|nr:DUF1385 domain-containing protein [Clostridia bacterium]